MLVFFLVRILLSGSSGFVGSHLNKVLLQEGHEVVCLQRELSSEKALLWDPYHQIYSIQDFEGFDAIIHLAGENIAGKRWTGSQKKRLISSRLQPTHLLSQIILQLKTPPQVFLCASAVGWYGDRGDELLTEKSSRGAGFLADLCAQWEGAALRATSSRTRVVCMRFGIVLGKEGGFLAKLLPLFRLGLGGVLGKGTQMISWISLEDLVRAIQHCLVTSSLRGPVNCVSPCPVSQRDFSSQLAQALHRPAWGKIPSWFLKCVLGDKAKELILFSQRVHPQKLLESGFVFHDKDLSKSLLFQLPFLGLSC